MSFPRKRYGQAGAYSADYFAEISRAAAAIDSAAFERAAELLQEALAADRTIYACGNGGSAAISNHLLCDFAKGMQNHTHLRPKIVSLSSHVELITAIANDIAFDDVFSFQLKTAARPGDLVLTISSSGNSENIVRPLLWAKDNGVRSIAMTGFSGGRSAKLADVNLHVPSNNYGVVEDLHQSMMHILAQYTRMQHMPEDLPVEGKF